MAVAVDEVQYTPSCWTCIKAGNDDKHSWRICKAAQDALLLRSKEKGGKGKGKCKWKWKAGKGGKGVAPSGGRGGKAAE